MSRRKQAKPQHLKSDEELPPPDGAPEHGEGPRGGGESSLAPASQCPLRGAGPGRPAARTRSSAGARGAGSCGRSKLGSAAPSWGAAREGAAARGRLGARAARRSRCGAGRGREGSAPPLPRRPPGSLRPDLGLASATAAAAAGRAQRRGSVRGSPTAGRGPRSFVRRRAPGAVRARSGAASRTRACPHPGRLAAASSIPRPWSREVPGALTNH